MISFMREAQVRGVKTTSPKLSSIWASENSVLHIFTSLENLNLLLQHVFFVFCVWFLSSDRSTWQAVLETHQKKTAKIPKQNYLQKYIYISALNN